jgi:hypothetical protein
MSDNGPATPARWQRIANGYTIVEPKFEARVTVYTKEPKTEEDLAVTPPAGPRPGP